MKNPEYYHLEFGVHTMKLPKPSEYEIILSGWGKVRINPFWAVRFDKMGAYCSDRAADDRAGRSRSPKFGS